MIGYYVHHQGLGHRTRALQIARRLRTPVIGFSSLPAPEGWPGEWCALPTDETTWPLDPTAHGTLHWAPLDVPGLRERNLRLVEALADKVSVLVVDVSVEVTLLARLMGRRVAIMAMRGERTDLPHRLAYDAAHLIIAPWTEACGEPGWPMARQRRTIFAGPISKFDGRPIPETERPPGRKVLLVWGAGGRTVTDEDVAATIAATPDWEWTVRTPQQPSPDLWQDLMDADVVVTHGGNNAVAEVAAARRPAVVVAQPRPFGEQHGTVRALRDADICVALDEWPSVDYWPDILERAVAHGGARWRTWSWGDGDVRAAAAIERLHQEVPGCCPHL